MAVRKPHRMTRAERAGRKEWRKPPPKPQHVPNAETRAKAWIMTAVGVSQSHISAIVGIAEHTLRKHYRHELDYGVTEANLNVAHSIYKKAVGNGPQSLPAAIYWMKSRAGWYDNRPPEKPVPEVPALPPPPIYIEFMDEKDS